MSPRTCEICGGKAQPRKGTCSPCNKGVGRQRATCPGCGRPDRLLDMNGLCRWCRERDRKQCTDCQATGVGLNTTDGHRVCDQCKLRRQLDKVIPDQPPGHLAQLRPVILAADPITTPRWLDRAHDLLDGLNTGRIPLDHATLDGLPHPKAVDHLRALLVSTNILPPDPAGPVRRLEASLDRLLAPLDDPHRRIVTRWIRWKVLPLLRERAEQGLSLETSTGNARRRIEQTVRFLTTLQASGHDLADTTQHHINTWFAGSGAARWNVRPFLAWAHERGHLPKPLELPASYVGTRATPTDPEERWTTANRLLTDDALDTADRVAGLLVVLYAQQLSRIVTLTTDDIAITGDNVRLHLGPDPVELPEPLATLVQQLPIRRWANTVGQVPTTWLFPGGRAGAHLHATALGTRLRQLGIEPRRMRAAALDQLTRDIPPAMLAGIIGLRPWTVVHHTNHSGGNWANYTAGKHHA